MEKFTVDLDKVLDEFEFNEEQAVRHALQHFKREDLPATKYQKPHFRPINIADADFGPCIETTMSYPSYHHKHSQEPSESVPDPDSTSHSHKINEVKQHPVVSDLIDSPTVNNYHGEKVDSYQCISSENEKPVVVLNEEIVNETSEIAVDEVVKPVVEHSIANNEIEKIHVDTVEINKESEKEQLVEGKHEEEEIGRDPRETERKKPEEEMVEVVVGKEENHNEVAEGSTEEKKERTIEKEVVVERPEENFQSVHEAKIKPDLIESESVRSSDVGEEESKGFLSKLPDLTEVNKEKSNRGETDKVESLDLIRNDKEFKEETKSEPELETVSESQLESQQTTGEPKIEAVPESEPSIVSPNESDVVQESENPVEDGTPRTEPRGDGMEETEIKPIRFESRNDITEEELQKYLEELEEEEEEEKRKIESESKPTRPDSLDLNKGVEPEQIGSPGQTPRPKNEEDGAVGLDNARNDENVPAESGQEQMETGFEPNEDIEGLIEASVASRSSEPPLTISERRLGKVSPFWIPDHLASSCMECDSKFTVIKRRHHCRACGRILCSKCCGMRASLEYLQNQEQRVCETCFRTLAKVMMYELQNESENESSPRRRPNPNNPMEYCSTVPPPLQVSGASTQPPPSVLVPVGVLKREGSSKVKETQKQVMFSDGIRPGGDLTELDGSGDHRNSLRKPGRSSKRVGTPPGNSSPSVMLPPVDPVNQSFITEKTLPPVCVVNKGETTYEENWPLTKIIERLKDPNTPPLLFGINRNLVVSVKIVKLDCCMKDTCWVICTKGMGCVGQDEIIVLLTLTGEEDDQLPKEVFLQFHYIYQEAARGNTVNELGYWCVKESSFLDSKQHGGFLFIRPTFQCLNRIEIPPPPFLVGVLIHRSEIPWARVFPFRLMLRLGAEFRYYPCPLVSVRFREPVYYEIGHTIINLLADFRNLSYTIPSVRGLRIHMEANQTSILIPRNRYDQVVRALNNSNDPVLALAGNFSPEADAHLVCMQSKGNEVTYSTHAININDKPRKVTGASFVVLNGALKTTSGVAAKSSIVEDGLMVQVPSDTMTALRTKLRNMEDWSVKCGPIEGRNADEVVRIIWCEDDKNFNIGVKSVIDNMPLDGVPSIRVHSGKDYMGCSKFIRWTQVFIIKCEDGATSAKIGDPLEVNKLSESIARATCLALIKLLELLAASGLTILAVRATIDQDNVGYEAGSNGEKLAPIYMNSLDNELIPVLHKAASINDSVAVLELTFHIMDQ